MLTQKYFSNDHLFSLHYPRTWDMEVYDEIPAFFDPMSGNGALQVFAIDVLKLENDHENLEEVYKAYPYLSGTKITDKMLIFLHMQGVRVDSKDLSVYTDKGTDFIPFEYTVQGRFYMSVMMEKENILLLAIYNSANQPDNAEAAAIGEIIKSIEIGSKVR